MDAALIIIAILSGFLITALVNIVILRKRSRESIEYYQGLAESLQVILDSKAKSSSAQRSTIKGQLAEQMYPLSEQCPYKLSDMRFMGMPIDYIIFDGYTECKDDSGSFREVIFAEIKSGSSQLSRHQREIRDAIINKRVRWETINI